MSVKDLTPVYSDGEAYEQFNGRWSRISGRDFIGWLSLPNKIRWLDVGCGTGALCEVILERPHRQWLAPCVRVARPSLRPCHWHVRSYPDSERIGHLPEWSLCANRRCRKGVEARKAARGGPSFSCGSFV